jgi:molybdate transport system regulatory protein
MNDFSLKYKIWIETADNEGILGSGKCKLLKSIAETNSLKSAMIKHKLTYRKTWDNLNKIEQLFGFPVIETKRGGKTGGQTVLTPQGQAIVDAFDSFHSKYDTIISQALKETLQEIKQKLNK